MVIRSRLLVRAVLSGSIKGGLYYTFFFPTAPGRGRRRRRPALTPSKLSAQTRHEFEIVRSETGKISFREKPENPGTTKRSSVTSRPNSGIASFFIDCFHLVKISNPVAASLSILSNHLMPLCLKFLIVPETM